MGRCVRKPFRLVVRPPEYLRRRRVEVADGPASVVRRLDDLRPHDDASERNLPVRGGLLGFRRAIRMKCSSNADASVHVSSS